MRVSKEGKFFWRKFFLFRLFRMLPGEEREHVMSVLPKKHQQELLRVARGGQK